VPHKGNKDIVVYSVGLTARELGVLRRALKIKSPIGFESEEEDEAVICFLRASALAAAHARIDGRRKVR